MGVYEKPTLARSSFVKFRWAIHEVYSFLSQYPSVFFPLYRLLPLYLLIVPRRVQQAFVVEKGTELVIEGFPRSGNTFAFLAFSSAQSRPVVIAHHTHVPAQVVRAARRGIPTIVLIRKPVDAIMSHRIRLPLRSMDQGFRDYIRFYTTIKRHHSNYVVSEFEEITSDFGKAIERLNQRFGTNFVPFVHNDENEKEVFRLVEERDREFTGLDVVTERRISRPSSERERIKAPVEKELEAEGLRDLIAKAEAVYREFTGRSS